MVGGDDYIYYMHTMNVLIIRIRSGKGVFDSVAVRPGVMFGRMSLYEKGRFF